MANPAARARFWADFLLERCAYPAPERLRAQLARAEFAWTCDCGCNTFRVTHPDAAALEPLASARGGYIFTADFSLVDGRHLSVLLFSDEAGHLGSIEVICQSNTEPVPEVVEVAGPPYRVDVMDRVFRE